jgi:hypothetical protein
LIMTQDYLVGEMSICLQRLEAATAERKAAAEVVRLRRQVETSPPSSLAAEVARALAVAQGLCWGSLTRGDAAAFERQARASAELREFAVCARLIADA